MVSTREPSTWASSLWERSSRVDPVNCDWFDVKRRDWFVEAFSSWSIWSTAGPSRVCPCLLLSCCCHYLAVSSFRSFSFSLPRSLSLSRPPAINEDASLRARHHLNRIEWILETNSFLRCFNHFFVSVGPNVIATVVVVFVFVGGGGDYPQDF